MIKRLRRRFIVITMISLFAVLTVIMTVINIFNYKKIESNTDLLLDFLLERGGAFDLIEKPTPEIPQTKDDEFAHSPRPMPDFASEETPYETRYFSVSYGLGSKIVDTSHIASVSAEDAIELANEALESGNERGYVSKYRFLASERMVIFVDCTRQLETARNFLMASIFVSIAGGMCVFLLLFVLSSRAVAPIVENYEKQKRFITDAGHELKTPLTIISASNELIELTEGESENTKAIAKQVARMSAMVKSLSTLAAINESSRDKTERISISEICAQMCELFAPVIKNNGRELRLDIASDLTILGDEGLIRQLISIILENAGKYSLTFVNFSTSKIGKRIEIAVSNDAYGLKDGSMKRCFERFYRSDEARSSGIEGSGIGLCVASEIVELHGGEISAFAEKGVFTIKILL